jgi:hypothetical protein
MVRHHKKTKKHSRRRRMRGGGEWLKPWTWGKDTPEQVAADAAPVVDATVGTPTQQAATLGVTPAAPSAPAGAVPGATPLGGRRRKTRKHRKSRRKH